MGRQDLCKTMRGQYVSSERGMDTIIEIEYKYMRMELLPCK
jgi:hypothetical protein